MNREVIVTRAVTGAGDTVGKHPAIRVTPEQIAQAAIEAAEAGAAIVHCHVREPDSGAPADTAAMKTMVDMLPEGAVWAGFGISAMEMPMVAQAMLLGGHVRVGLEDNLYLERGVFASNAQLVEKAVKIIELMGARVLTPAEARGKLGLEPRN